MTHSMSSLLLQDYFDGKYKQLYDAGLISVCRQMVTAALFAKVWPDGVELHLAVPTSAPILSLAHLTTSEKVYLIHVVCRNTIPKHSHNGYLFELGGKVYMKEGYLYVDRKGLGEVRNPELSLINPTVDKLHEVVVSEGVPPNARWARAFAALYHTDKDRSIDEQALLADPFALSRVSEKNKAVNQEIKELAIVEI